MELSIYLEELYHKPIAYTKTNLGLSNTIYKAYINGKKVAIRVPNQDIHHLLTNDEKKILDLVKKIDLDVNELYYDEKTHIRITEWVDDALTYKECKDANKHIKAIKMIKKLHDQRFEVEDEFDPYTMYRNFKNNIDHAMFDYERYEDLFLRYRMINHKKVLCHNDLVSGNLLFSGDKCYLIDYEYAGMNDPYFDVMSFISENDIDDRRLRNDIICTYLGHSPTVKELKEFKITEMMMDLLWACWANMLYDKRKEEIYREIYESKIQYLLRGINEL